MPPVNAKLNRCIVVWFGSNYVAHSVDITQARDDPLMPRFAVYDSPHEIRIVASNYFEVAPVRLQPMPAPDIVFSTVRQKGFEVFVERIFEIP